MQVLETRFRPKQRLLVTSEVHREVLFVLLYTIELVILSRVAVKYKTRLGNDISSKLFNLAHTKVLFEFKIETMFLIRIKKSFRAQHVYVDLGDPGHDHFIEVF